MAERDIVKEVIEPEAVVAKKSAGKDADKVPPGVALVDGTLSDLDKWYSSYAAALEEEEERESVHQDEDYLAPVTPAQADMCALWQELLQVQPVGIRHNWFALGGNDKLTEELARRSGYDVPTIMGNQTIAALCDAEAQSLTSPKATAPESEAASAAEADTHAEPAALGSFAKAPNEAKPATTDTSEPAVEVQPTRHVSKEPTSPAVSATSRAALLASILQEHQDKPITSEELDALKTAHTFSDAKNITVSEEEMDIVRQDLINKHTKPIPEEVRNEQASLLSTETCTLSEEDRLLATAEEELLEHAAPPSTMSGVDVPVK